MSHTQKTILPELKHTHDRCANIDTSRKIRLSN